jgi:hypothetical protein
LVENERKELSVKIFTYSLAMAVPLFAYEFIRGLRHKALSQAHQDRILRGTLAEGQIDKMLKDTFPASDPLSNY